MTSMELDIKFRDVHRLHWRALELRLNKTGIYRAQHQILMYLSKHPQCAQKEIAERFKISPAAVTSSLKKLERGGYLERTVNQKDNRVHQVRLTEKGKSVVEESHGIFQGTIEEMYQDFSQAEMEHMMEFYQRMEKRMEKICREEREK